MAHTLGLIGLGKMGGNMARRLAKGGIQAALLDQDTGLAVTVARETGGAAALDLPELVAQLQAPRVVWVMLPSGPITERMLEALRGLLSPGDTVVDGANSNYRDSVRRAASFEAQGLHYVDAGVSGGIHGLAHGYCLMVGGTEAAVAQVAPFLRVLATGRGQEGDGSSGWLHVGPAGAGHFTKMIHNGIEYGMMAALAEGLSLMKAKNEFDIDLAHVTELWRHGSVVRSWLLDLTADQLRGDADLHDIQPVVADSGEGRWTALESVELGVPTPVMTLALMSRFASQGKDEYASKLLAKMRQGFGGHAVAKK